MRTTFFKKPLFALFIVVLAAMLSSCGGGSSSLGDFVDDNSDSSTLGDLIDDVVDTSDLPGWELNGLRFFASDASKNSVGGYYLLTTTSLGLNSANDLVSSVVTMQYKDNGPGDYTLVSSIDQLFSQQNSNPEGKFLLIVATILNSASSSNSYQSDDLGIVNVTNNALNDLVFNIPSPVNLIKSSGDAFPSFPLEIFFTLIDIFEDLPTPSLP